MLACLCNLYHLVTCCCQLSFLFVICRYCMPSRLVMEQL